MSSKKIYTTVGLDMDVVAKVKEDAFREHRSRSFIVEKILRDHYSMPWEREQTERQNANKA